MRFAFFLLSLILLASGLSLFLFPENYIVQDLSQSLGPISFQNPLGFDSLGRDYLSRLLVASRISLSVAILSTLISFVIGVGLALYLSSHKSFLSFISSRAIDLFQGLPSFMLVAVVMSLTNTHSIFILSLLMGLMHWPSIARITQAELIKLKAEPFVEASTALGASPLYIFRHHLAPACKTVWLSWFCFHMPGEVMFESSMSFLGFGVQPPQVSLGGLILESWQYLGSQPHYLLAPATLLFLVVWSLMSLQKNYTLKRKNKTSPSFT